MTFPAGLNNFIRLFLESQKNAREQDSRELIIALLNTEFEDQTQYKKVTDLVFADQKICVECLAHHLGRLDLLDAAKKYRLLAFL